MAKHKDEIYAGHVFNWSSLERADFPWAPRVLRQLQVSGVQRLIAEPCDLLLHEMEEFYNTVELVHGDEETTLIGFVGSMEIQVSASIIHKVFQLPEVRADLPKYNSITFARAMHYTGPITEGRELINKGFVGEFRFLAYMVGKCLLSQSPGDHSLRQDHLLCMYCLDHEMHINWAYVVFRHWVKSLHKRGFGRLLSRIMKYQHPATLGIKQGDPYPINLILRYMTIDGIVGAVQPGSWVREAPVLSRERSSPSQKPAAPRRQSIHVSSTGEHFKEGRSQAVTPEENIQASLHTLRTSYLYDNPNLDRVQSFWSSYGELLISAHEVINWGYDSGKIDQQRRDAMLANLEGQAPATTPFHEFVEPHGFPSSPPPAKDTHPSDEDRLARLEHTTRELQKRQKQTESLVDKLFILFHKKMKSKDPSSVTPFQCTKISASDISCEEIPTEQQQLPFSGFPEPPGPRRYSSMAHDPSSATPFHLWVNVPKTEETYCDTLPVITNKRKRRSG